MNRADQKQILVIGSTCVDVIINIDHLPKTEEDIHPFRQSMALGGCAYNVANTIRLFGAPLTFISPVGTGFYGEYVEKELARRGFPVRVHVPDRENGCCYCLVERGGERTFMSLHGAEYTFQKAWMDPFEKTAFDMAYICGLEVEEPTGGELVEYLETRPARQLFYAPGPRGTCISAERTGRLFALHPVLHINEAEALSLSGCNTLETAASCLAEKTRNAVIVTLGERGTYCLDPSGRSFLEPSVPTAIADTIGAGDSHIGTILACLSLGFSMREAVRRANRVAAAVVGVPGASLTEEEFASVKAQF